MISRHFISSILALVTVVAISSTSVMAEIAIKKTVPLPKPVPIKGVTLPKKNVIPPATVQPALLPGNTALPKAVARPRLLPKQGITLPKQKSALPKGVRPILLPGNTALPKAVARPRLLPKQGITLPKTAKPGLLPRQGITLPKLLPKRGITLPKRKSALPKGARPISLPGNRGLPAGARPNLLPKQGISLPGGLKLAPKKIPGVNKHSDTSRHLRKVDLGVRVIQARIARRGGGYNEVEVEVINHGSDVMYSRNASVRIRLSNEKGLPVDNDGACYWSNNIRKTILPDLQVGERRILLFRSPMVQWNNNSCFDQERHQPDRSKFKFTASINNTDPNDGDSNLSNNWYRAKLSTLLPARRLTVPTTDGAIRVRPVESKKVRVRIKSLSLGVGATGDSTGNNREQTGELKWIKIKFHTSSEVRIDHKQLSISENTRGKGTQGRHKKNWLLIKRADRLYPSAGLSLVTTGVEGKRVSLKIKARDLDCVKNRDCNRGDNGTTTLSFRIPHDAVDLANCSDSRSFKIASLPSFNPQYGSSGSPGISLDTRSTPICFERID